MGKPLRQQRRGKGSQRYRSPCHRFIGRPDYSNIPKNIDGIVKDIVHAPGRKTPVAIVDFGGRKEMVLPPNRIAVSDRITSRIGEANAGVITELFNIPEGTKIFNIELTPGDGGRLCRSSGASGIIITKEADKCMILLPSNNKKVLSSMCRATIGYAASSGRKEKPFMKAGNKHHAMKAVNRYYPITLGVSKNALNHPFGGQTRPGKPKTVSRHSPPGKKVGSISPKRTGKRKR